jgi:response regulator RpfG family c-di-GMP phosphodiesterase
MKTKSPTVLVVDDEKNVLDSLSRNLNNGFHVITALAAQEALDNVICGRNRCEELTVVISDYSMAGMNGIDFLNKIKNMCPEVIRVMLTGVSDLAVMKNAVNETGIFRLLTKPCPVNELIKAVNDSVLEYYRRQQGDLIYGYLDKSINSLMAALGERDSLSGGHADRISELSYILAFKMGLSEEQLLKIEHLSMLHDIGKIGIPDEILFKEGPLSDAEWSIMKTHTEKGCHIAQTSPELSRVANLILTHHESWDGSGYPLGLKGKEIPLESRIIAVTDAYDAMTNDRPYRKALSREAALKQIRNNTGIQFDPEVVSIFLEIFNDASVAV